jgi:RimJ/RimL family protein N-acetyltransferase
MIKNPLLLDLPMPITTARLSIRPMMPGDGKQVFEAIDESREMLSKWHEWVAGVKTWEDSECTAREFYANFILRKSMSCVIFRGEKLIGVCGYNDEPNWATPAAAIGYWCRVSEQSKGYMREATAALTLYAFQQIGFKRLAIACEDENVKSAAIPEALGFTLETKAKGLIPKPGSAELSLCRRYVRFDAQGLEEWDVKW